jgi:hypothetical protein
MTNTSREVGGVFGIALLGTILTTRLRTMFDSALDDLAVPPAQHEAIADVAGRGILDPAVVGGLPPGQRAAVVDAFRESFMSGFRLSLVVAGLVLLAAAVVANRFIPGRGHEDERVASGAEGRAAGEPTPALEF